jgi:hypothetical protein
MKKIIGLVLLVLGAVLVFNGINRKNSLAGEAANVGATVANKIDGGTRLPEHAVYIGGGAVLVLVGVGLTLQK